MKKGFTLIELLAVIVILALIALITIPAVLRITENAKISSYRRSIDLYGRAINTAVMAYKSDMVEKKQSINVNFDNVIPYVDYEGYDISCEISKIYSDDTVLLTKCSIENDIVYAEKGKGFGSENYYYYTNSKKRIKALLYVEAVNKALQGKENIGTTCEVISEGNIRCNNQTIEVTGELGNPKSGILTIENNQVTGYSNLKFEDEKVQTQEEVPQVVDEQQINTNPNNESNTNNTNNQNNNENNNNNQNNNNNNQNDNENNNNTNNQNLTNTTDNYIGYYADVDGDGNADGVIYADLAHSKSGDFYNKENNWNKGFGTYSYEAKDNLKEYTVSETNSPITTFGTNKIITLKPGSTGNSRFYVMALSNFREGAYQGQYYYWYKNAYEKMPQPVKDTSTDFGTGYENTKTMIRIWNNNGNEEGWTSGATQYEYDIWGKIQSKYQQGWYIPSRGEWAAFADYLANRKEAPLTSNWNPDASDYSNNGNYDDIYGLSSYYWSSSQGSTYGAWCVGFYDGSMGSYGVLGSTYVRLGVTF